MQIEKPQCYRTILHVFAMCRAGAAADADEHTGWRGPSAATYRCCGDKKGKIFGFGGMVAWLLATILLVLDRA